MSSATIKSSWNILQSRGGRKESKYALLLPAVLISAKPPSGKGTCHQSCSYLRKITLLAWYLWWHLWSKIIWMLLTEIMGNRAIRNVIWKINVISKLWNAEGRGCLAVQSRVNVSYVSPTVTADLSCTLMPTTGNNRICDIHLHLFPEFLYLPGQVSAYCNSRRRLLRLGYMFKLLFSQSGGNLWSREEFIPGKCSH